VTRAYHLVSPKHSVAVARIVAAVRAAGVPVKEVPFADWVAQVPPRAPAARRTGADHGLRRSAPLRTRPSRR
jgi:hypothetical protein